MRSPPWCGPTASTRCGACSAPSPSVSARPSPSASRRSCPRPRSDLRSASRRPPRGCWCTVQSPSSGGCSTMADVNEEAFDEQELAAALALDAEIDAALAGGPARDSDATVMWLTRSEEHTSELQSLMRISYAVFCLTKKNANKQTTLTHKILSMPMYKG